MRDKFISTNLDAKEREIAKLCAFGFTTKEIAGMLYTSESTVSHTITRILAKTGLLSKKEFSFMPRLNMLGISDIKDNDTILKVSQKVNSFDKFCNFLISFYENITFFNVFILLYLVF